MALEINDTASTDVLDGAMITLAMYTLNIFHPGYLLPQARAIADDSHSLEYQHTEKGRTGTDD